MTSTSHGIDMSVESVSCYEIFRDEHWRVRPLDSIDTPFRCKGDIMQSAQQLIFVHW